MKDYFELFRFILTDLKEGQTVLIATPIKEVLLERIPIRNTNTDPACIVKVIDQ